MGFVTAISFVSDTELLVGRDGGELGGLESIIADAVHDRGGAIRETDIGNPEGAIVLPRLLDYGLGQRDMWCLIFENHEWLQCFVEYDGIAPPREFPNGNGVFIGEMRGRIAQLGE